MVGRAAVGRSARSARSTSRPARPVDSASLVILRGRGTDRAVLMGRRRAASSFMPGWYVFPGGCVEADDFPHSSLGGSRIAHALAHALAMAAIRETFEETGLIVGRRVAAGVGGDVSRRDTPLGRACAAAGRVPAPEAPTLIARAITPVQSPRRFHTRFFLVDEAETSGVLRSNGELVDLHWVPLDDRAGPPIADVTAFVLDEAARASVRPAARPVPLLWYRGGRGRIRRGMVNAPLPPSHRASRALTARPRPLSSRQQ